MLSLAINTASSKTAIAILKDRKIVAEQFWQSNNDEAEKLMPSIDKLLKSENASYSDIKKVIVVKGPGSFTGLRIGVTVANTIAHLQNCDLYSVDTFSYWWNADKDADENTALLVFAGSRGVYVSKSPEDPTQTVETINIDELQDYLTKNNVTKTFGDISAEQKAALGEIGFKEIDKTFGEIISEIEIEGMTKETIVKPCYIKKPGITPSKKTVLD